jgi:hypothetical protein
LIWAVFSFKCFLLEYFSVTTSVDTYIFRHVWNAC